MCEYDRRIITTLNYSQHRMVPVIVRGSPAIRGQMPYLVSIKEPFRQINPKEALWTNLCGGTIISEWKVLTAAHCFEDRNFYYKKHPGVLRLVAGNFKNELLHSGSTVTDPQMQWRKIKKVILHKDFAFPQDDIALIFVDEPWNFTADVNYATLAETNTDYPGSCYSTGFGMTGFGKYGKMTDKLLQARINTMTRWDCNKVWEMDMSTYICSDSVFSDVANGDSGGPLGCKFTYDPAEEQGRDLLVGVVSGKNFDKTTLFTRVSAYRQWMKAIDSSGFKLKNELFLILIIFLILKYYPLFY